MNRKVEDVITTDKEIWILVVVLVTIAVVYMKRRSEDPGARALLIDGSEVSLVEVKYDGVKGQVVRRGRKPQDAEAWTVPPDAKPRAFWKDSGTKRFQLLCLVTGEERARVFEIPTISDELRLAMKKSAKDPQNAGDHLTEELVAELEGLGVKIREPLGAALVTANGTFDNRELARLIDGNLREAFRDFKDDTEGVLAGALLGAVYALMLATYIPPDILRSPFFGTVLTAVFFVGFMVVWIFNKRDSGGF